MAKSVKDFRGASSLSTWLYTVARSYCIKKRRRSKFAPDLERSFGTDASEHESALVGRAREPDEALAGKQVQRALEQAIDSLDPMYKEVLILRDAEGLTAPEVAEVLGLSVDAVKSRLHRARLAVREKMAPVLGIPTRVEPVGWVGLLVAAAIGVTSASARAQERSSNEPERTAGWTILGLGLGLGSGSAMTGAILLASGRSSQEEIGVATLAGGATTMVVSLIVGVALLAPDSKPRARGESSTTLARALSGQFRW